MNTETEEMDYYHEQELFFGRSASLVYRDNGETGSNLYVGGATDSCHVLENSDEKCWTLSITKITHDGSHDHSTQINPYGTSFHTDEATAPYIDHMHLDQESNSDEWLFGSTRSSDDSASGSFVFIWRMDLDPTTKNPRADNLEIVQISPSIMQSDSYVSGFYKKL